MNGKNETSSKYISLRDKVRQALESFHEHPESVGFHLRLNLSTILCDFLDQKDWSQKRLAEEAGVKESFLSRVINADQNCTFDVAGRLLFALGLREEDAELTLRPQVTWATDFDGVIASMDDYSIRTQDVSDGKKTVKNQTSQKAQGQERVAWGA